MDPEKFYLPEVKLGRSRGGGSGLATGSCGDLFGRTAPLLGQASNRARRAETRRLRTIKIEQRIIRKMKSLKRK